MRIDRLEALGYILAVAMPPLGLGIGLVLTLRPRALSTGRGIPIVAVSLVAAVVWVVLIKSGAFSSTSEQSY